MQLQNMEAPRTSRIVSASPVYYGWVILFVGTVGIILTGPGQTYAVSVFIDYFITDLGITRGLVSTLYTAGTLVASFAMPFMGRQIDQLGSRRMMVAICLFFGLACIYMGYVSNAAMLLLGFVMLRMLGQGSLSLVSRNVINQWWVRRRGMAMGIAGMASALLSSGGFPNLLAWMIPAFGWRTSYFLLGLMIWVIILPLGLIFVRNRPEEYGLTPDGDAPAPMTSEGKALKPLEENWTRAEALRTSVFWLVSAGIVTMSALGTGLTFHIFDIFRDSGLSRTVAALAFVPMSATAAIVQLAGGFLMDRIAVRVLLAIALFLQGVVLLMAPHLSTEGLAYLYGTLAGMGNGLQMIVGSVIWAKYFGRLHLGSISGVSLTLGVAGSALGPMPFGIARDWMGGYTAVLSWFAIVPLVLAVVTLLFVRPPVRETE